MKIWNLIIKLHCEDYKNMKEIIPNKSDSSNCNGHSHLDPLSETFSPGSHSSQKMHNFQKRCTMLYSVRGKATASSSHNKSATGGTRHTLILVGILHKGKSFYPKCFIFTQIIFPSQCNHHKLEYQKNIF